MCIGRGPKLMESTGTHILGLTAWLPTHRNIPLPYVGYQAEFGGHYICQTEQVFIGNSAQNIGSTFQGQLKSLEVTWFNQPVFLNNRDFHACMNTKLEDLLSKRSI